MESKIRIYKIKESSVDVLRLWGKEIMGNLLSEAVASLKEENCLFEEAHVFSLNGSNYLLGIMLSGKNTSLIKGPDSPINIKHRQIVHDAILEQVQIKKLYTVF